jgi:hypothetical protein
MAARLDLQRRLASIAATSVALFVVGLVGGSRAHAQSAEAEALFNDGNKLMAEGKLAPACDAFEASNRVEPRAGTLIRLGECRERNQQLASAWSAYKDALTRVKDPRKRAIATAKARALESRLSYLTVVVSDDIRIAGLTLARNATPLDPMLWNRALPIDGGDYVIAARAPGHEEWQTTAHIPIEGAKVSVEVPKLMELSKLTAPPTPAGANPSRPPSLTEPRDHGTMQPKGVFTTRRKISIGVAGASVVSMIAGAVLGTIAKGKQSDAYRLCPDPATPCTQADQANALLQSSRHRAFEANVAFGIAAAAGLGAGVLWLTGAPDEENPRRVSVVPSVMPGETGGVIMGRF